jgi:hypothetical protein
MTDRDEERDAIRRAQGTSDPDAARDRDRARPLDRPKSESTDDTDTAARRDGPDPTAVTGQAG